MVLKNLGTIYIIPQNPHAAIDVFPNSARILRESLPDALNGDRTECAGSADSSI